MATDTRQKVLDGVTATNSAPSAATDGIVIPSTWGTDEASVRVKSTAGSGTMTVTLRAWAYDPELEDWLDLGQLNDESSIGETSADSIRHAEPIVGLYAFSRFYLEVTAIGGTSTAIDAWLVRGPVER